MMSSRIGLRIFSTSSSSSSAEVNRAASGGQFNAFLLRSGSLLMRMASSSMASNRSGSKRMTSYWGVAPRKILKDDGSEWRWSCFRFNAFLFGSRSSCAAPVRMASSSAAVGGEENGSSKEKANSSDSKQLASYWGVAPRKLFKEDGSEWRWSCFRPWDSYMSDTTIDIKKHHTPKVLLDKIAYWTVKLLRVPTDIFFQRRYGCRAMMLETVAAVPGMVGGMLLHLRSLRRFEHSGGWVRALLEEAENERMHLMTFMEVTNPRWYERALVIVVQGIFFNAYFLGYLISPKFAHRIVGYLEEEAIHSYTEFLKDLDNGNIENVPAPEIAKDYWRLPSDATLRDVVIVVRADEAHHRDVNHFASDVQFQGMELQQNPAPLGYH